MKGFWYSCLLFLAIMGSYALGLTHGKQYNKAAEVNVTYPTKSQFDSLSKAVKTNTDHLNIVIPIVNNR